MHTIYGPGNPVSLSAHIEPAAIFTFRVHVWLLFILWKILVIVGDENLSYHESTDSENDEVSLASPRGSFNGDTTLEKGELTGASQDQSALQEIRLSLNGIPPSSNQQQTGQIKRDPTQQVCPALQPLAAFLSGIRNPWAKSVRYPKAVLPIPLPQPYWRQKRKRRNTLLKWQ